MMISRRQWWKDSIERMFRYFSWASSLRYIEVLPELMASYNHLFIRSIKMAPSAITIHNECEARKRLYPPKEPQPKIYKFNIDDRVRIWQSRLPFQKGTYLVGVKKCLQLQPEYLQILLRFVKPICLVKQCKVNFMQRRYRK